MISIEDLQNVKPEDAYRLLTEVKVEIYGELYKLYTEKELRNRVELYERKDVKDHGLSNYVYDDFGFVKRDIVSLVNIIEGGYGDAFLLRRAPQARIIVACIKHFLNAQVILIDRRQIRLTATMLNDYKALGLLVDKMYTQIVILDGRDEIRKEEAGVKVELDFFQTTFRNISDDLAKEIKNIDGWINPFEKLINQSITG